MLGWFIYKLQTFPSASECVWSEASSASDASQAGCDPDHGHFALFTTRGFLPSYLDENKT